MTRSLREGEDVQLYSFFNSNAIWLRGQRHARAALPPGKITFFQILLFCATYFKLPMFMLFCIFQNVIFPTCFRSSNWSFIHGFLSLNLLHNIILSFAFNMV